MPFFSRLQKGLPHCPLFKKLISLNIDPFLIRWVAEYLTLQYQHVVVESTAAQVLSGVPQGSVLGSLLFLVYKDGINLFLSSEACSVTFADDVCVYRPIYSRNDYKLVQKDILAVKKWSNDDFFTLNTKIQVYAHFKRVPTGPEIPLLHNLSLSKVNTFKYLGVLYCLEPSCTCSLLENTSSS